MRHPACTHTRTAAVLATLLLGAAATPAQAEGQEGELAGRVVDASNGRPVVGADVALDGGAARVSTAADGTFLITKLEGGTYRLTVTALGYAEATVSAVRIGPGSSPVEVQLTPSAVPLSEITVSPGTFSFGGRTAAGRQTLSRADIDAVPQFAEDVFRAVNRLPGLTSPDFSSRFSIRGGRPNETLIRIDGLEIYEPYHLKDFNDGAISIVDSEVIDGVELMTGGFPARYGNYTSGVFNIETRDATAGVTRYGFGLSLVNARAMAEGTFARGKGSYFVSGRRGYLDLVLGLLGESGLPSPAYHDVFGKVKYQLAPGHTLALNVLQASDRWTFDAKSTTGFRDTIDTREDARNRYGNAYGWVTQSSELGDRAAVRTIASASRVTSRRRGGEYYTLDSSPLYDISSTRDFDVFGLRHDWTLDLASRLALGVGFDARSVRAEYRFTNVVTQDPDNPFPDSTSFYPTREEARLSPSGSTLGAHASGRLRLHDALTIEVGGRYDRASYTGDRDFSPRFNALLKLTDATTLRGGWGVFRQMQGLAEVSILDPTQQYFPAERSRQWTASLEHIFQDGGVLRIEAYRKLGDGLRPVYRNWKAGLDVFPETNEDRILVRPESTRARGIEVYAQKHLSDRLSVRGSYALASIEETVAAIENVNDPYPLQFETVHGIPHDQRHAVNVDATYRPWLNWSLTSSVVFHTGWPGTLQHGEPFTNEDGNPDIILRPDPVYGSRMPSYFRMDVRFTRRTRYRGGDLRVFLEVSNLTNRTNVFGYDYERVPSPSGAIVTARDPEGGLFIIPSLGLSWSAFR